MAESYSAGELELTLQRVRTGAKKYITNFYVPQVQLASKLKLGLRVVAESARFVVLVRQEEGCERLFFAGNRADMTSTLLEAKARLESCKPLVTDLIGQPAAVEEIFSEFAALSFCSYLRLIRLSRMGVFEFEDGDFVLNQCQDAGHEDITAILDLLRENFDIYTDQFPCAEEMREAIDSSAIRVSRNKKALDGFLWYEKTGGSSLIKYWCTDAGARGRGIGGILMRDYFEITKGCARHLLWVRENNKVASSCYSHYGYNPDGIQDHILKLER